MTARSAIRWWAASACPWSAATVTASPGAASAQCRAKAADRAGRPGFSEDFRRFFLRGTAALLPTLITLRDAGARVIVCSHLGRPKGAPDPKYTLAPVATRLGELLGNPVVFAADTVGESAKAAADALLDGQVLLLGVGKVTRLLRLRSAPQPSDAADAAAVALAHIMSARIPRIGDMGRAASIALGTRVSRRRKT